MKRFPVRATIALPLLLLLILAGCRPEHPRGVAYIIDDGYTTRAYYREITDHETYSPYAMGHAVDLPFNHPVDMLAFNPEGDELWAWSVTDDGGPGLFSLPFADDGPLPGAEPRLRVDLSAFSAPGPSAPEPGRGGHRVFFDALVPESGSWQLFVLENDEPTQLTEGEPNREIPVLSPDGKHLVFSTNDDGSGASGDSYNLWVYELAAGRLRPLVELPGDQGSPSVSADGRLLFNSGPAGGSPTALYITGKTLEQIIAGASPDPTLLLDYAQMVFFPRLAGDGALLFTAQSEIGWRGYVIPPGSQAPRLLMPLPEGAPELIYATWRPAPPAD